MSFNEDILIGVFWGRYIGGYSIGETSTRAVFSFQQYPMQTGDSPENSNKNNTFKKYDT